MLSLLVFAICGCSSTSSDEKIAENYVKTKGYDIIEIKEKEYKYTLEKTKLYMSTENIPYINMWALQKVDPDRYFSKQISIYHFIVKNHPLEKIYKVNTNIYIMICDGKVIGGASFPNERLSGSLYSLEGKTLEEVTGLSYGQWSEKWNEKYRSGD